MERKDRIAYLQESMKELGLSGALLFYSRDVFYYTGTAQPAYLVVLPEDYFLYVRAGFEFASHEVFIERHKIRKERRLENVYKELFLKLDTKKIGTELDILPTTKFFEFTKVFSEYEFVNISPIVLDQRKRKDEFEIERIKEACEAIDSGHRSVLSTLREGITELDLAAAVENAHRQCGHEGIFFIRQPDFFMSRGPISSGPNLFKTSGVVYTITGVGLSPSVPAGPSRRKIVEGDLVVVDIPILVNGYHADQTRTYVLGKSNEEIALMYCNLKEIADYLVANMTPGMTCSEIYRMAINKSEELKVGDTFLSFSSGEKSRLIGHGIGLELNEPPTLSSYDHSKISDGYVIALDMHMLRENVGVIKLEDMILVGRNGNQILTKSPRELFEVGR
jgi:Xaa-Pro dipeptidase